VLYTSVHIFVMLISEKPGMFDKGGTEIASKEGLAI
jgi:hypothetical protein